MIFQMLQVTTLNLDKQHISKLSNLERLENLRWASFNDNDITKIEVCLCVLKSPSIKRVHMWIIQSGKYVPYV